MPENYATVPRTLIEDHGVSSRAKEIYAVLTKFANRDRLAWPYQSTIATTAGCSIQTVERAVRELKATGWVTIEKRFAAGPCTYRLNLRREIDEDPDEPENDCSVTEASEAPDVQPNDGIRDRWSSLTDEGNLPSHPRALSNTYLKNQEHLAPRGALTPETGETGLEDGYDPLAACGLFASGAVAASAKEPGARHLAYELRDAWQRNRPQAMPGDINVAACAGQIAAMRRGGVTVTELRSMINLFVEVKGFQITGAPPWKAFLSRRHALLLKVRTAAEAIAAENDPSYWIPKRIDSEEENRRWLAEQMGVVTA